MPRVQICEKMAAISPPFKMTMCAVAAILIKQCLWCLWHLIALSPPSIAHIANVWGIHFQVMPRAQICEKVATVLPPFQMTMGA